MLSGLSSLKTRLRSALGRVPARTLVFSKTPLGRWTAALTFAAVLSFLWLGRYPLAAALTLSLAAAVVLRPLSDFARLFRAWSAKSVLGQLTEAGLVALALAILTHAVLGFVIADRIPVDRGDHHVMIARAELLTNALLEGRLQHWSHAFQGGDSLVDLYPVFLNYLAAGLHFAFGRDRPFIETYSFMCVAAWWLRGVAAYFVCRRFAGPLAAAATTWFALFDVGAEVFDGVWHGVFYWGMIHNNLALSFGLFATALAVDLSRRVTTARFVACALAFMVTSFSHPLGLLWSVLNVACFGFTTLFRAPRVRRGAWTLGAVLLGILLAAFWAVPYSHALSLHGFNGAIPGIGYGDLGRGMLDGSIPVSSFGAQIGVVCLAVVAALISKRPERVAVGLLSLAFVLLALTPFLVQTRVLEAVPSFLEAQQRRGLTAAKCAVLPCGAALLSQALRPLWARPSLRARAVIGRALVLLVAVLGPGRAVVTGNQPLIAKLREQIPVPAASKHKVRQNDTNDAHRDALRFIAARRKEDSSATPWRMTYWDRWNTQSHAHWIWAQGVYTGVPVVDFGWASANFIRYRPREFTAQGMIDWNIRYAISLGSAAQIPGFELKEQFGPYRVWEFTNFDPRFVIGPPDVTISKLKVRDDRIEFEVKGAPPGGAPLTVRSAWFPRWQARAGGRELTVKPVAPHPGALPGQEQIGLVAPNGRVVLSATATMPRFWPGVVLSLAAALVLGFASHSRRRRRAEEAVRSLLDRGQTFVRDGLRRVPRPMLGAVAALVLLLLLSLVMRRGSRLLLTPPIEGIGMDVSLLSPGKRDAPCQPHPWQGRYVCRNNRVTVEPTLGVTPPPDQSGEYGEFWPGTLVTLQSGAGAALRFPSVDGTRKKLVIDVTTSALFEITLVMNRRKLETKPATGYQKVVFTLPGNLARSSELRLEFRVTGGGGGAIAFRGNLE
jgi:hypothetical protein